VEKSEYVANAQEDLKNFMEEHLLLINQAKEIIDSLTSSKLKTAIKLMFLHPIPLDTSLAEFNDGKDAKVLELVEISIKLKDIYLNQFLASAITSQNYEENQQEIKTEENNNG